MGGQEIIALFAGYGYQARSRLTPRQDTEVAQSEGSLLHRLGGGLKVLEGEAHDSLVTLEYARAKQRQETGQQEIW